VGKLGMRGGGWQGVAVQFKEYMKNGKFLFREMINMYPLGMD
jgi:hypothetical protein